MSTKVNNENVKFDVMVYPALFQESPADHTYVKFANGVTFPCAGGSTGGEILKDASGEEDIEIAKKFNEPLSIPIIIDIPLLGKETIFKIPTGEAGIIYAINGVCHTIADRILVQSKVIVKEARGFLLSSMFFGAYGLHVPYVHLLKILLDTILQNLPTKTKLLFEKSLTAKDGIDILEEFNRILEYGIRKVWKERLKKYNIEMGGHMKKVDENVLSLYDKLNLLYTKENLMTYPDISIQEYETTIKDILGEELDDKTMQDLIKCMQDFHNELSMQKNTKSLNKELISDMNNKANDYLKNINKIIGDDKYEKLFNAKPSEEIILFDEKEFNSMLENVKNSLNEQFKNNRK